MVLKMPQESGIAKQVAFATTQKYVKIYFVARIFLGNCNWA
jgi:hypothetical protein